MTIGKVQFIMLNPQQKTKIPLQTILTKYYKSTHSKQYLINVISEIIPTISYYLLSDKLFQIIVANYYQRNDFKHYLVTTISEFIPIDFYTNFYQRNYLR